MCNVSIQLAAGQKRAGFREGKEPDEFKTCSLGTQVNRQINKYSAMAASRAASENHGISYPSIQAAGQPFNQCY